MIYGDSQGGPILLSLQPEYNPFQISFTGREEAMTLGEPNMIFHSHKSTRFEKNEQSVLVSPKCLPDSHKIEAKCVRIWVGIANGFNFKNQRKPACA
jgi:hypothetical protein